MSEKPSYPPITPYLLYEDAAGALEWLARVFGFHERLRFRDGDGQVTHAEMKLGDGVIMLGQPGGDYRSPVKSGGRPSVLIHVYVDDVDAHLTHAKGEGATITSELEDKPYGDRSYAAEDLEGQNWTFAQHVSDVAPSEWGATHA